MAIYAISFVIRKDISKSEIQTKPLLQLVTTNGADTFTKVIEELKTHFKNTDLAKEGWYISGDPMLRELFLEDLEEMKHLATVKPKVGARPSYLRLVT